MHLTLDQNVGHTPTATRAERADRMIRDLRVIGVPARIGKLQFGDVSFSGRGPSGPVMVGIELKTVAGLLGDIVTGRFVGHQVPGMQEAYQHRYLIVEGPARPSLDGMLEIPRGRGWATPAPRMMYIDLMKILEDIEVCGGFHVRRTGGRTDTLYSIAATFSWWQKDWKAHKVLKQFHESTPEVVHMTRPSLVRRWAKELTGVGWERSEAIERVFRTPIALANAKFGQLVKVPGVGIVTAERAWREMRGLE